MFRSAQPRERESGLTAASAQALLNEYAQAGYLTVTGTPWDRATLTVVVTPQSAPTDGANDPANQVLLGLRDGKTVLWGGTDDAAQKNRELAVLLGGAAHYIDVSAPGTGVTK